MCICVSLVCMCEHVLVCEFVPFVTVEFKIDEIEEICSSAKRKCAWIFSLFFLLSFFLSGFYYCSAWQISYTEDFLCCPNLNSASNLYHICCYSSVKFNVDIKRSRTELHFKISNNYAICFPVYFHIRPFYRHIITCCFWPRKKIL